MKIVNAKKIMGAVALALLVGCFASCAQDNVKTYETADINGTVKVEGFAEAVAKGIDFTGAAKKGYKVTLVNKLGEDGSAIAIDNISFTPDVNVANGTIFPFVQKDGVYTFKITDDNNKEVISFAIRASVKNEDGTYGAVCGNGELKTTATKATGTTSVYSTTGTTPVYDGYKITIKQPTFEGAPIVSWKTDYLVTVDDGIDIPNAILGNEAKEEAKRWNNNNFGFAGSFNEENTEAALSVSGIRYNSTGFKALAQNEQVWALLAGRNWFISTRTYVRAQNDNNIWFEIESAATKTDAIKPAVATKNKVNQKYNLSVAGYTDSVTNSVYDFTSTGYVSNYTNWMSTKAAPSATTTRNMAYSYTNITTTYPKKDVYDAAANTYSYYVFTENKMPTSEWRDLSISYPAGYVSYTNKETMNWKVFGMPGKQITVKYPTGSLNSNSELVDYVVDGLEAGSAWKEPEVKPYVENYFYKDNGSYWKTRKVETYNYTTGAYTTPWNGYYRYTKLDADGKDVYEHAYITNRTDGNKYTKSIIVPTYVVLDYSIGAYNTVQSYWDTQVTVYLNGTCTYNK